MKNKYVLLKVYRSLGEIEKNIMRGARRSSLIIRKYLVFGVPAGHRKLRPAGAEYK